MKLSTIGMVAVAVMFSGSLFAAAHAEAPAQEDCDLIADGSMVETDETVPGDYARMRQMCIEAGMMEDDGMGEVMEDEGDAVEGDGTTGGLDEGAFEIDGKHYGKS